MKRLADLACVHPRRVLVITGVIFVVAVVLGGPIINVLQASLSDFENPATQTAKVTREVQQAAGAQDELGMVALVHTGGDPRKDAAARAKEQEVAALINEQPGLRRSYDYTHTGDTELISPSGRDVIVMATFATRELAYEAAQRMHAKLGSSVSFGGLDIVFEELTKRARTDLERAELLAFPLLLALSLWVFRGLVAAALPLVVGVMTILCTFLALRGVEQFLGISVFALNLVSALGLGLAIDYSLFVLSRYREERPNGDGAIARTLQSAGRTVLYSSLTVAAAMASLCVFPLPFLYSMGIGGALTALIGGAVSLVVLPAVLVVLGDRIDALAPRWLKRSSTGAEGLATPTGMWSRLAQAVMRRPGAVALATGALLLALGAPALAVGLTPASSSLLPTSSEARQVDEMVKHEYGANPALPIAAVVQAPPQQEQSVLAYARTLASASGEPERTKLLYLGNSTFVVVIAPRGDPFSTFNEGVVKRLRKVPSPYPVAVGGITAWFMDQLSTISARLPIALAIIALTMFATIFAMTGSAILPLKTFVMNLLTLCATTGVLVLVFQDNNLGGLLDYRGNGGLEPSNLLLLFTAAFALTSDYGVFLLGRIKEAHDAGLENRPAVAFGLEKTGRLITAAALLFCVAMGALVSSSILSIKELGFGAALAVAIDASIVRALLVPSLMALLGKWNWWAPSWLRRIHERVGVREHAAGPQAPGAAPIGSPSSPGP